MLQQYFEKPLVFQGIESADFKSYLDSFAQDLNAMGSPGSTPAINSGEPPTCVYGLSYKASQSMALVRSLFHVFVFTCPSANAPGLNVVGPHLLPDGRYGSSNISGELVFCRLWSPNGRVPDRFCLRISCPGCDNTAG
jgi:hypothetical protein